MDGVQLHQGYTATTRRQFTFYQLVPKKSWYLFDRPRKDEKTESTQELLNCSCLQIFFSGTLLRYSMFLLPLREFITNNKPRSYV